MEQKHLLSGRVSLFDQPDFVVNISGKEGHIITQITTILSGTDWTNHKRNNGKRSRPNNN